MKSPSKICSGESSVGSNVLQGRRFAQSAPYSDSVGPNVEQAGLQVAGSEVVHDYVHARVLFEVDVPASALEPRMVMPAVSINLNFVNTRADQPATRLCYATMQAGRTGRLGHGRSRDYVPHRIMATEVKKKRQYLIALETRHSVIALIAGILIFCCAMGAIFVMFDVYEETAREYPLHYFTVRSNILTATAAAFMIPFAVEGIRKKRFGLPHWISVIQYVCTLCVTITMLCSLCFILPVQGLSAVTGTGFWLHLVSPLSTLLLFQCVETGTPFTKRDTFIVQIPYWIYIVMYYIKVVIIGEENGGWPDFYMTMRFWPAWVSIILLLLLGYGVAIGLRTHQNWRIEQTHKRMTQLWADDMDTTDVLVEAFGLGRYMGKHCETSDLPVPVDIFLMLEERYNIPLDKLLRSFMKGAADAIRGRGED